MGTHPIFESDFDCLTECRNKVRVKKEGEQNLLLLKRKRKIQETNIKLTKFNYFKLYFHIFNNYVYSFGDKKK